MAVYDPDKGEVSLYLDGKRTEAWKGVDLDFGGEGLMDLRIDKSKLEQGVEKPDYEMIAAEEKPQEDKSTAAPSNILEQPKETPLPDEKPVYYSPPDSVAVISATPEKSFLKRQYDAADAAASRGLNSLLGLWYEDSDPELSEQFKLGAEWDQFRLDADTEPGLGRSLISSVGDPLQLHKIASAVEFIDKEIELIDRTLQLNAGKILSSYYNMIGDEEMHKYLKEQTEIDKFFLEEHSPNKVEAFIRETLTDPLTYIGGIGVARSVVKKAVIEGTTNGVYTGLLVGGEDMNIKDKVKLVAAMAALSSIPGGEGAEKGAKKALGKEIAGEAAEQLGESKIFFDTLTNGGYTDPAEVIDKMVQFQRQANRKVDMPFDEGRKTVLDDIAKGIPPKPG